MKKFSELNKVKKSVEEAKNNIDFIESLISETLSVEDGKIKGIDVLVKTLHSVMELNESKTKVKVLETVKAMTAHSFDFKKINEAIAFENGIIRDYKLTYVAPIANDEHINELNREKYKRLGYTDDEIDELEQVEKNKQDNEEEDKVEESVNESSEMITEKCESCGCECEECECEECTCGSNSVNEEVDSAESDDEDDDDDDEDDDDDDDEEKGEEAKDIEEQEVTEDVEQPVEEEINEEVDETPDPMKESFVTKVKYPRDFGLSQIDELYGLMESINNTPEEELLKEHHLSTRSEKLDFVIGCMANPKCKTVILDFIGKLPGYVKTGDIDDTINQLSDTELDNLYMECEEAEGLV